MILLIVYMLLFMIVCLFGVIMVAYVFLKPFKAYFIAKLKGKDCMFVIQKDGKILMAAANFWDSVYGHKPVPPWSYLRQDATLYRLGGVKCIPIIDNWNITKDCELRDKVGELQNYGIDTYEQMRSQMDIETAEETQSYISGEAIDMDKIILKDKPFMRYAFEIIDFDKILEYIDSVFPTEIDAYIDREISNFLDTFVLKKNKGTNWTLIIIILAIVGGLCVMGALGAKLIGLW